MTSIPLSIVKRGPTNWMRVYKPFRGTVWEFTIYLPEAMYFEGPRGEEGIIRNAQLLSQECRPVLRVECPDELLGWHFARHGVGHWRNWRGGAEAEDMEDFDKRKSADFTHDEVGFNPWPGPPKSSKGYTMGVDWGKGESTQGPQMTDEVIRNIIMGFPNYFK